MSKSILILSIIICLFLISCIGKNDDGKKITKQDSTIVESLSEAPAMNEILFVGMIEKKSGLYKYNFSTKSYSEFWQSDKEEVVKLSYSPNKKSAFLLTAHQAGKKGVFPFIDNVKLYSINLDSSSIKFIEHIGSGLQLFSFWEDENSFKVILNIIDVTIGKYVDQEIKTYDTAGGKLSEKKKKYDLTKEGYPQFPMVQKKLTSPDKKYSIESVDSTQTQIYLIDHPKNDEKSLITELNQKLNFVDWSDDGKILFFSTIDISPGNETLYDKEPTTSKLFIFSIEGKKIIKLFENGGIKNFMLNRDILLFDNGFKESSKLVIYNFRSGHMIDSVKISGGCGLTNIPIIPDYGA